MDSFNPQEFAQIASAIVYLMDQLGMLQILRYFLIFGIAWQMLAYLRGRGD